MSHKLIVETVGPEGHKEVGSLENGELTIGRSSEDGITIDNSAISRNHGLFLRMRNHWFYKDTGSTNGSWRNGKLIKQGEYALVRAGDVLQLADVALRMKDEDATSASDSAIAGFPQFANSTLIVFAGDQFHDEFPLPEYGRALVVGGHQGDLKLEESIDEVPRLVIERRGDKVVVYGIADGPTIFLNGGEISSTQSLTDGDDVKIAQYTILFNDPGRRDAKETIDPVSSVGLLSPDTSATPAHPQQAGGAQAAMAQQTGAMQTGAMSQSGDSAQDHASPQQLLQDQHLQSQNPENPQLGGDPSSVLKDWDNRGSIAQGAGFSEGSSGQFEPAATAGKRQAGSRFTFGQTDFSDDDDVEGTMAIDPSEVEARLAGYDIHRSSRYSTNSGRASSPLSSLEDKLIVFVGFILLLGLMGAVIWLVLL